jgi:hypothetical protein
MSLLKELEILGAGLLQRWRTYGALKFWKAILHAAQPQRGCSFQPSVGAQRLRWGADGKCNNPEGVAADGEMNREIH